jgi:hypothetical protein
MDGTGEHHVKWRKTGSERQRLHDFLMYGWYTRYKYKHHLHTHTHTHTHVHIYTLNMFPKVGLLEETKGGGKEERNDREWIILKYITFV